MTCSRAVDEVVGLPLPPALANPRGKAMPHAMIGDSGPRQTQKAHLYVHMRASGGSSVGVGVPMGKAKEWADREGTWRRSRKVAHAVAIRQRLTGGSGSASRLVRPRVGECDPEARNSPLEVSWSSSVNQIMQRVTLRFRGHASPSSPVLLLAEKTTWRIPTSAQSTLRKLYGG